MGPEHPHLPGGTDYEPSVIPSRLHSLTNTKLKTAEKANGFVVLLGAKYPKGSTAGEALPGRPRRYTSMAPAKAEGQRGNKAPEIKLSVEYYSAIKKDEILLFATIWQT